MEQIVLNVVRPIIREYFPHCKKVKVYSDVKRWKFNIEICMPESDYIADLLALDLGLDEIVEKIKMRLVFEETDVITIKHVKSTIMWKIRDLKELLA